MKQSGTILMLLWALGVALPVSAGQDTVDTLVARYQDAMVDIRQQIHANPELGNSEHETAALVAKHLRSLDFDKVEVDVAHTGVVGILKGGKPGPVIAVRADMDALPVKEQTDLAFASTKTARWEGREVPVMHACGHDIHTAVALGVASVLAEMRDEIAGTVKFIFQPAEEGPPAGEEGGAPLMMEEGALENPRPEAIFALHASPDLQVGQLGYTSGPAMAAVDHFYITIKGKQSHGAQPHGSIDPVVMGSQAVMALQTIASRNVDPLEPAVVTVGMFQGGERFNIIPEQVKMEGTVRTYSADVRDMIERRMGEILDGTTRVGGGNFELRYDRVTPATINNPALTKMVVPGLIKTVGENGVKELKPTMGGEDFAFFSQEVPGFYFRLGTTAPGGESGGLHTPTFRGVDESVPVGIRAMSNVVLEYLQSR
ncbi:MAG: amidohydrolase [Pseudomonadales bacterium]